VATHELKTHPEPFAAACDGRKRHEVRVDDRTPRYAVGDTLNLREWQPPRNARHDEPAMFGHYTGRGEVFRVTYLTRGPEWGVPAGMVVMSIASVGPLAGHRTGHA
jgi:hypothetical protein